MQCMYQALQITCMVEDGQGDMQASRVEPCLATMYDLCRSLMWSGRGGNILHVSMTVSAMILSQFILSMCAGKQMLS